MRTRVVQWTIFLAWILTSPGCTRSDSPPPKPGQADQVADKTAPSKEPDDIDVLVKEVAGKPSGQNKAAQKTTEDADDIDGLIKDIEAPLQESDRSPPSNQPQAKPIPDDNSSPPKPPVPRKPVSVQLPKYFDQLHLSNDQLERMAKIAQPYDTKINAQKEELKRLSKVLIGTTGLKIGLVKSIKKLSATRTEKLEEVLTPEQRDQLNTFRSKD